MDRVELTQFWQQNLAQWEASGLSGNAFCKQQSLTYHQFVYWRKRLNCEAAGRHSTSSGPDFAREDESAFLSERAGCDDGLDALRMSSIT